MILVQLVTATRTPMLNDLHIFHVQTCADLYYCISTCLCFERNDQLQ